MLVHEGRPPIEIARLQRYAADAALAEQRAAALRRAPRDRTSASPSSAPGPAGLACAGELAARGHDVTVFDERHGARRARPLRDRAVPPARRAAPGRGGARSARSASGSSSAGASDRARPARARARATTRSCSPSGSGEDTDVDLLGDDLDGVWDSLPFIEAIKTGTRLRSAGASS